MAWKINAFMKFPKMNCVNNERKVSSFTAQKASLEMSDQMKTTHYLLFMYKLAFLFLGTKIFTLGNKKESSDRVQSIFVEKKAPKLLPDF
jgi:hypothetical protein